MSNRLENRDLQRQYVASLTGLRGIAALFVFLFHYGVLHPGIRLDQSVPLIGNVLQFPFGFGWTGVDLFFVLSGFLLTLPFAQASLRNTAQSSVVSYYKRRLLRVFPAYYAQLAIILLVGSWFVTFTPIGGYSFVAHLLMFFNIGTHPVSPLVGIWWTLPVELSFYLILPLIAAFLKPRRWFLLLAPCILLSIAYRIWAAEHLATGDAGTVFLLASQLPGSLPEFLLGASAALLVKLFDLKGLRPPSKPVLDVLFGISCVLASGWLWYLVLPNGGVYWKGHWTMIVGPIALGGFLSLMVLSLYWGSRIGRWIFANPLVYFLGLISYSLYLWHFVVMQQAELLLGNIWGDWHGLTKFLVNILLVILVSALSYYLFERPFLKLGKRR